MLPDRYLTNKELTRIRNAMYDLTVAIYVFSFTGWCVSLILSCSTFILGCFMFIHFALFVICQIGISRGESEIIRYIVSRDALKNQRRDN